MSTTTYVFMEKLEKYQYFWFEKIALFGAMYYFLPQLTTQEPVYNTVRYSMDWIWV